MPQPIPPQAILDAQTAIAAIQKAIDDFATAYFTDIRPVLALNPDHDPLAERDMRISDDFAVEVRVQVDGIAAVMSRHLGG